MPEYEEIVEIIETSISTGAAGPQEAEVDGVRAKQHSLRDLIYAHRYLRSQDSGNNGLSAGIRFSRLVPPGALGE